MKENTDEESLVAINENNFFLKIKRFFRRLFHKDRVEANYINVETMTNMNEEKENKKNTFVEEIRKIEDDETRLLKLQKQYRSGEINEKELTDEQINSLCDLYDKQITNLKKSNEERKQKLLIYRKKMLENNS